MKSNLSSKIFRKRRIIGKNHYPNDSTGRRYLADHKHLARFRQLVFLNRKQKTLILPCKEHKLYRFYKL